LIIQPDGKILAAGSGWYSPTLSDGFALARLNANGSLDAMFGNNGTLLTDITNQMKRRRRSPFSRTEYSSLPVLTAVFL
jgi:hypothetical protein